MAGNRTGLVPPHCLAMIPMLRPASTLALLAIAATLAACTLPVEHPVVWDSKTAPPQIEPMTIGGHCSLLVSGTSGLPDKAISHVALTVERGLARIDVDLAPADQWTSSSFHVLVPVEEQHVSVIYVGATRYPVWEHGRSKDCPG